MERSRSQLFLLRESERVPHEKSDSRRKHFRECDLKSLALTLPRSTPLRVPLAH